MLTREEIVEKLKANPDWGPDSTAPDEVWDMYYEVLDSTKLEEEENEDTEVGWEEPEENDMDGDWDEDDI